MVLAKTRILQSKSWKWFLVILLHTPCPIKTCRVHVNICFSSLGAWQMSVWRLYDLCQFNPSNVQYKILTLVVQRVEFPPKYISSSTADRNKILAATPVFSGSNFSMVPMPTFLDIPFNWKSKMAAVKRKFPYLGLYMARNKNSKGYYHTVGHH